MDEGELELGKSQGKRAIPCWGHSSGRDDPRPVLLSGCSLLHERAPVPQSCPEEGEVGLVQLMPSLYFLPYLEFQREREAGQRPHLGCAL